MLTDKSTGAQFRNKYIDKHIGTLGLASDWEVQVLAGSRACNGDTAES